MPDIRQYVALAKLLLVEGGKYFALLLFAVLAIRLWRNGLKVQGGIRTKNIVLAVCLSVLTAGIGWFSIRNSMGKLYLHYANQAFDAGKVEQAYVLFDDASGFWLGPDAAGGKGVCLVLLGVTNTGEDWLQKAKNLRQGHSSPFEQFYPGLYYFMHDDQQKALPLLEEASTDYAYRWNVTKILAIMDLDQGHPEGAARLMQPYAQAEITDSDHAYIVAALDVVAGKKNDAQALLDKFANASLLPLSKARFDKLQVQINSH
jgi:hypothetical protein